MFNNRRNWFRNTGLLFLGVGVARMESIASPLTKIIYLPSDSSNNIVRLSSNENPYGPSPMAQRAMTDTINLSNRYQWKIIRDLISAIASINNVSDKNILVGAGSIQIINTVLQFVALQKGNFILAGPTYNGWANTAQTLGLTKIEVPLTIAKQHDLPAMLNMINTDTKLVYLCNPNNPTGTICSYDSIVSFIKEATKRTLVLVDEAYLDYTNETSLCSLVLENENLIVTKTFSKIYGLAGARIGYAIADSKTIEKINQHHFGANIGIGAVSLAGAIASLKDTDFVKESYLKNEKTRSFTIEQLEQMNIHCIPSYANFIYFSLVNFKKNFSELLKTNNIEGTGIWEEDGKWSRITVGTMDEMKKFISALG